MNKKLNQALVLVVFEEENAGKVKDIVEKAMYRAALIATRGNKTKAAKLLGVSRTTATSKIDHHNLDAYKLWHKNLLD